MTTVNFNYGNPAIGDLGFVYAKLKWMHSFKAFNLKGHFSVIPSMIEDTKNNREKLQSYLQKTWMQKPSFSPTVLPHM